jgi:uncharacterized membrane protein YeaQ/YmgE (transglycosylase-associated protein family)
MIGVGLLGAIIVGLLAGFIAEKIMGESHGLIVNLVVGLLGAVIGPQILAVLGVFPGGTGLIPSLIISTVGAVVLLALLNLIRIGRPTAN